MFFQAWQCEVHGPPPCHKSEKKSRENDSEIEEKSEILKVSKTYHHEYTYTMLSATFVISVYFISGLILIFFNLFWILAKLFSKLLISASQDRMTEQQGANRKRVGRGLGKNNKRDLEDPDDLLKREISKSFESDNSRGIQKFKGVVDSYDGFSLYTVLYDDGDREQLSTYQIKKRLIIPFTRRTRKVKTKSPEIISLNLWESC